MANFLRTIDGAIYLNVDYISRVAVDGDIASVWMTDRPDYAAAYAKIYEVAATDWLEYYEAYK